MILSKNNLPNIEQQEVNLPQEQLFTLPERVLQFGTGVLLRGLPDYFIDKANKQGIFNGRIVVVKSTANGSSDEFGTQDSMFTQCIKGVQNNEIVDECVVNASISRVLSAASDWNEILKCAANPDMQLVISNTTEVGITLVEDDKITGNPPTSFPGKLLAFLLERYRIFNGSADAGMVIVPTELITDNGTKLKLVTLQLARLNNLDATFIDWLENANDFCNSLVDRIVPGRLPKEQEQATLNKLGYKDDLMIMSEVYRLWAIETANKRSVEILSFSQADSGVIIAPNINKFRELKLRLLNGTHTFSCGLAYLAGFETVKEAMADKHMSLFVYDLMVHEISPCIESVEINRLETYEFANAVIDRFRNPHIDHRWLSITMNYTGKMKMRNLPLLTEHYNRHAEIPEHMAAGFAAYLLFMKATTEKEGKYYGELNGTYYHIQDDWAGYYYQLWKQEAPAAIVKQALSNNDIWATDLTALPGFEEAVNGYLQAFMNKKITDTLINLQKRKQEVAL